MRISQKLKQLRNEKGLTLKELSSKSGVSVSFISDIENDRRNPSIEKLTELSKALDVSIDVFFRDNIKNSNNSVNLSEKNEKDIAKDLETIMNKLTNQEDGPLYYNGDELGSEDKELFKDALELALKTVKLKNKEKYTPKKYKE